MSTVRIKGLKQEGVNCFWKIFASIEGRVKGYEELINGKFVQPNIKLFLSLMQKSTGCFYEIEGSFYQHFIKTKLKQFKECKDREIHTKCLYWFTQHLSYIQSSKTTENTLCNQP